VYDGKGPNFKVCGDSSCPYTPNFPDTNLDRCDDTLVALQLGDEVDSRASTYCEYKVRGWSSTWRDLEYAAAFAL